MRVSAIVRLGGALAAAAIAAVLAPGPAKAAEPLPVQEVAPGVFVYQAPYALLAPDNKGAIANVSFIVGDEAVAVIDTGNSLQAGERLLASVREKTKLPIRYVINTHMHPDHVLGDAVFRGEAGVKFVAHEKFAQALQARAQAYIDAGKRQMGPEFKDTTNDVVMPDIAVKGEQTLDLGGRKLTLEAEPVVAHTDNDLTVFDEKTGTWLLGDLLFMGHVPAIDGSIEGWTALMKKAAERKVARVVPGHGPASAPWPDALVPQQRYLDKLKTEVQGMIDGGMDMREASEKAGLSERDAWALFDEFNTRNAIAAYRELEWK